MFQSVYVTHTSGKISLPGNKEDAAKWIGQYLKVVDCSSEWCSHNGMYVGRVVRLDYGKYLFRSSPTTGLTCFFDEKMIELPSHSGSVESFTSAYVRIIDEPVPYRERV